MGSDGRAAKVTARQSELLGVDCLLLATNPAEAAKAMALVLCASRNSNLGPCEDEGIPLPD